LSKRQEDPRKEGWRAAVLHIIAALSGILMAVLAKPVTEGIVPSRLTIFPGILAVGLLASGGSGFWNAILSYFLQVKNIKKYEAQRGPGN
jgi:hypothetical protein